MDLHLLNRTRGYTTRLRDTFTLVTLIPIEDLALARNYQRHTYSLNETVFLQY